GSCRSPAPPGGGCRGWRGRWLPCTPGRGPESRTRWVRAAPGGRGSPGRRVRHSWVLLLGKGLHGRGPGQEGVCQGTERGQAQTDNGDDIGTGQRDVDGRG